jgi:hypothetical protein
MASAEDEVPAAVSEVPTGQVNTDSQQQQQQQQQQRQQQQNQGGGGGRGRGQAQQQQYRGGVGRGRGGGPQQQQGRGGGGRGQQHQVAPVISIAPSTGIPFGHVPPYLPGSSSLVEELNKRILVVLRDGRHLVGVSKNCNNWINNNRGYCTGCEYLHLVSSFAHLPASNTAAPIFSLSTLSMHRIDSAFV